MRYNEDAMLRIRFTVTLLLFISATLSTPLFAQHVPGTDWKQRETERFIIMYPDTMSDEAAALAVALDDVLIVAGSLLPVTHKKKKWPLVLTNLGLESNGFVTLAPQHSVWYATPGEDFTAVSDWWMLLARHETRHMAQFDAADQGATRVLHILFGELGWGTGIVLGTPTWLLEGDAVVMETTLSKEGRGRDPLFTMEVMAMVSENPDSDYFSAVNPSYKNHIPDYYRVGYSLTSWIRHEYGGETLEEIYRSSARIPIPVIGLNTGTKRSTDKKPKELYREMAADLILTASALHESTDWTAAEIISPVQDCFTRYDSLFDAGNGMLYARKETLSEAPSLVLIDSDQNEKEIIRLPRRGRVSMAFPDTDDTDFHLRIAWDSLRYHPVFLGSSVSDITIVDLDRRHRVIRRKTIVTKSRYLYPALSPDGSRLAAVEILENGGCALVILDADSGEIESRTELRSDTAIRETAAYPSWSPDGKRLVFSVRNDGGRRIAEWDIETQKITDLTETTYHTVKTPVYSLDGQWVFYSSNESGLEAVWAVRRTENNPMHYIAAQRWYGAYKPAIALDGKAIYVVEYASAEGEAISRIEFQADKPGGLVLANCILEENPEASYCDAKIRNPENRDKFITVGNIEYPESDYNLSEHAFNVHSWGLYPGQSSNSFLGNELVLNLQSRDVLGTLSFEVGALYEVIESSPGAYMGLSFTGIRPVIGIQGEYRYRSPQSDPFHQTSFSLSALYPTNLARTGIWNHILDIGITGGLLSYFTNGAPSDHYPFISYMADWSRLRPGSRRAIRPDLGWRLRTIYSHIPLPDNYGYSTSAELDLYFPGGFKNTSLGFGAGIEHRTVNFTPRISRPRGYNWENPDLTLVGSVDYEFPLGYPDLPLGSVIFIQRFRLGLFSDFGYIGTTTEEPLEKRWSTGAVLTMDFSAFNNFPGLSIGIQFSWLWQEMTPRIDVMIMELSLF